MIPLVAALKQKLSRRIKQIIHSLGFSCLGGALFLQILVFVDILQQGYFMAVEHNQIVLAFEVGLTAFALIYFIYIYQDFMRSIE
jgi:hypothetical protein